MRKDKSIKKENSREMMKLHDFDDLDKSDIKELVKEKGSKAVCKERVKASKAVPKTCDSVSFTVHKSSDNAAQKSEGLVLDKSALDVDVIANMAMFMDSAKDVLTANSWSKSVNERGEGDVIPFLRDHTHSTMGLIGKTRKFSTTTVDLQPLGYEGTGQGLLHQATVIREYNKEIHCKYLNGSIKQHSIGLMYEQIFLALDDDDEFYTQEKQLFDEVVNSIINKELAIENGYFWYVTGIKLIENSAVLFGANSLTPTLSVQPTNVTEEEAKSENRPTKKGFYTSLITGHGKQIQRTL